jgi:hypothetical protein
MQLTDQKPIFFLKRMKDALNVDIDERYSSLPFGLDVIDIVFWVEDRSGRSSVVQVSYISTAVLGSVHTVTLSLVQVFLSLLNVSNSSPTLEIRHGWINRYFCTSLTLRSSLPLWRSSTPALQQLLPFSSLLGRKMWRWFHDILQRCPSYAAALSSKHITQVGQRASLWH